MIIIINTPPDKYYPLPSYTQVCVCVVWSICHMLFFADVISARRFPFPGLLWRSPNEPPLTHSFGNVFGITPGVTWAGYYRPVCLYSYIHSPLFCIFRFEFDDSRLCYLFKWGFSFRKSFFFLNCSTALFCTSHYKRKKNECPINPTAKP
jgi:hypothetical protein